MFKKTVKNFIGKYQSTFDYPIIVNSYGRSGSTVLTRSIIKSAIKPKNKEAKKLAFRSISQTAWDLGDVEINNGLVYKTHDYPPSEELPENTRMLYTYADPVDVVLSLVRRFDEKGEDWMKEHYKHLNVEYSDFDLINHDQLKLEYHLSSWLEEKRFPIAFIKYEHMWDHQEDISNFLGFDIQLPTYRKRKAKDTSDTQLVNKVEDTYSSLRKEIDKLNHFSTNI